MNTWDVIFETHLNALKEEGGNVAKYAAAIAYRRCLKSGATPEALKRVGVRDPRPSSDHLRKWLRVIHGIHDSRMRRNRYKAQR